MGRLERGTYTVHWISAPEQLGRKKNNYIGETTH